MTQTEPNPETTAPDEAASAAPEPQLIHGAPVATSFGQDVAFPTREQYPEVMKALLDEGFNLCADLCGADYLSHPGRELPDGVEAERFEVVVNLVSFEHKRRLRVRVQIPESDPTIASLFGLWPGTEAMEREVWDMFGVAFSDHPDLTRILMPEDWEGHPLRKDYAIGRVPVQFKATTPRPDPAP
jgi:NADH-quinone oxidoreductase subunit C